MNETLVRNDGTELESAGRQIGLRFFVSSSPLKIMQVLFCVTLVVNLAGCQWLSRNRSGSWWMPKSCRFSPDMSQEELVAALNQDAADLQSWESTNVTLKAHGQGAPPFGLPTRIAVERPQRFRLMASSPLGGSEVDIGSNDERFWFWMKIDPEKNIYYANHEDLQGAQAQGRLPLHPDWLMSAFGMQPLDSQELTMTRLDERRVQLTPASTAERSPFERTIIVDLCEGHVVEQLLTDRQGKILARLKFEDYHRCHNANLVMAHRITIDSPASGMTIEMNLGRIQANPPQISANLWSMPTMADARPMNLKSMFSPSGVQTAEGIEEIGSGPQKYRMAKPPRPQTFPVYRMQPATNEETPLWEPKDDSPF
ncbi:MAG: hypothetical protein ACKVT0_17915 [Planctomycetaceae bacterium]